MDRLSDLIEDARMRELEIERDIETLAWYLAAPLIGLSGRFAMTAGDRNACAEILRDAAKAALARQLKEARDEADRLDQMEMDTQSARLVTAGSVSL